MKQCRRCKEEKSSDLFPKDKRTNDGLASWCKKCYSQYTADFNKRKRQTDPEYKKQTYEANRKWAEDNHERVRAYAREYYSTTDWKEYMRLYRLRNKEKYRESMLEAGKKWARKNLDKIRIKAAKRRAKKASNGGTFTQEDWLSLCEAYGNVCLCCKQDKPLTIDHVVPIVRGGSNQISNIQPLCRSCNAKKGTRVIDYRRGG